MIDPALPTPFHCPLCWPVYLTFSLGLLTLAGVVAAAAIATSWHH
jgi:hypothetical protein